MEFITCSSENLGSIFEIKVPKGHKSSCEKCFEELKRIEKAYSRFKKDSELSKVNSRLNEWHKVSDEFITLLQSALEFSRLTEGNFDITIKSALDKLGYDSDYSFRRQKAEKTGMLDRILGHFVDSIKIDLNKKRVLLRKEIEFGGFGKGYCLDRLSGILDNLKVQNYLINAGGDIRTRSDGKHDWDILLEHPDDNSRAIGKLTLNNKAFAASAPNRRRWGDSHHLINAKTRLPQNSVKCIFIVAKTGMEADAYSTALFTAGFEDGIKISARLPIEMLIVSDKGKMYMSKGFDAEIFN